MNDYRVHVEWSDGEHSTYWVEAKNENMAIFLIGSEMVGGRKLLGHLVVNIYAVLETN